jgi:hypothetical protein
MDGVVEIITGRERRRRWSLQDKVQIVAESNEPGSMIRAVAARHGVCESLARLIHCGSVILAFSRRQSLPVRRFAVQEFCCFG